MSFSLFPKLNYRLYRYYDDPLKSPPTFSYLAPIGALLFVRTKYLVWSPFLLFIWHHNCSDTFTKCLLILLKTVKFVAISRWAEEREREREREREMVQRVFQLDLLQIYSYSLEIDTLKVSKQSSSASGIHGSWAF